MLKQKEYLTIFIIIVTEVLGFSLILPFLPFYVKDLGGTPFTVGLILTTFSLLQFISAPIMGKLSDTYGRKPLLMISQFSTFLSFIVLGFAKSIPIIFLSRAIDGLLGSNGTIAQSYLSDISSKKDRSKAYGVTGAAFGFGFLIGPAIGGFLSKYSFSLPAFISSGFSLGTIFMTYFLLKETVVNGNKEKFKLKSVVKEINVSKIISNLKNERLKIPLFIFFAYILSHTVFVSNFSLFSEKQYSLTAEMVGYTLALIGFVSIIIRGFLLGKILDIFEEHKVTKFGYITLIIGLVTISLFSNFPMLLIAVIFFSIGSGLLRPTLMADISRNADDARQGEILGVAGSLGSIAQILGPMFGGLMLTYAPSKFFPFTAIIISFIGLILFNNKYKKQRLTKRV